MALDCVLGFGRRVYRPVVSDFDQGDGSGMDEPGTSNRTALPSFLPVPKVPFSFFDPRGKRGNRAFFYLSGKSGFPLFDLRRKCRNRAFFTRPESPVFPF